jgi:hypothetical protein
MSVIFRVTRWVCEKLAQNVAKHIFAKTFMHNVCHGKSGPKIWDISAIFIKRTKANNDPMGNNSPNLATLVILLYPH